MTRTLSTKTHLLIFLLLAGLIALVCQMATSSARYALHPSLSPLAVTIDMAVVIPLVYFLLTRHTGIPRFSVLPVTIAGVALASWLLPASGQQYVNGIKLFLPITELSVVGFLAWKVAAMRKSYRQIAGSENGFIENLHTLLLRELNNSRAASIFSTEISMFYYGIAGWGRSPEHSGPTAFSYHKKNGYQAIVTVFFFLAVVELVGMHLLVALWSSTAAWVLSILSVYGLVFLFADRNAARKRPVVAGHEALYVRTGLRWRVAIPYANIARICAGRANDKYPHHLSMALIGSENVTIELREAIIVTGLYGISRTCNRIGLSMDDKAAFIALVQKRMNRELDETGVPEC